MNWATWDLMCLRGGMAYHLLHTRHWCDSFPPGPVWDLVKLLMICSMGILPRRSLISAPSVLTELTSGWWDLLAGGCFTLLVLDWELPDFTLGVEVIMFPPCCCCSCCCWSLRNFDLRLAWAVSLRAKVLLV